jgi:hypothetical protein
MFSIVIEVSAILVATIIFPKRIMRIDIILLLIGVGSKIFIYLSTERFA